MSNSSQVNADCVHMSDKQGTQAHAHSPILSAPIRGGDGLSKQNNAISFLNGTNVAFPMPKKGSNLQPCFSVADALTTELKVQTASWLIAK